MEASKEAAGHAGHYGTGSGSFLTLDHHTFTVKPNQGKESKDSEKP